MIIHSVMPIETVMQGFDEHQPAFQEIELGGVTMQVETVDARRVRIVRLFSPDPQDYLNPHYTPGTIIAFAPNFPSDKRG
ncbi:YlzJ-like family protein [Paenibacillus cymbidii]|uniref:YlzJ-like family protein n=1 Tax=Paenibacillus cymbidii TaxID=1639034 RepID=UPI0010818CA1|nr:YlzJ-like family protein [Paenibacillus cymbidii]